MMKKFLALIMLSCAAQVNAGLIENITASCDGGDANDCFVLAVAYDY